MDLCTLTSYTQVKDEGVLISKLLIKRDNHLRGPGQSKFFLVGESRKNIQYLFKQLKI